MSAAASRSEPSSTATPVILDVDTGVDDALALLFAVRSPDLDLRAVSCVCGNVPVDKVLANTLYVLDAAGAAEVPVARGASRPLLSAPMHAHHVHGEDGLGGFSRQSDRRTSPLAAVELLRRTLLAALAEGERITLIPLAPLTNIALLLRTHPEVAAGIERVVFMGGSASVGNATAVAEFNVWHDVEAAAIVLAAASELEIPVTMYGLDVFGQVRVDNRVAASLTRSLDPAVQLAGGLINQQCRVFDSEDVTIGDAGTVCAVADPSALRTESHNVRVVTESGYARGQTIVDRRTWGSDRATDPHAGPAAAVDVALSIDGPRYAELFVKTVAQG